MTLALILTATALAGISGLPGLLLDSRSAWGQRTATTLMSCGAALGLLGSGMALHGGSGATLLLPGSWMGGGLSLGIDALSAVFLIPIFVIGGLGSIYGLGYWPASEKENGGRGLGLFWGWLVAGMATVVLARHAMLFLLGWEAMALSAFFLIGTETRRAEVREAAFLYLIATHLGTLCLFAMFGLLRLAVGSFDLRPIAVEEARLGLLTAIFCLALVGFGLKAGLMPLHFWLPSAHTYAPSHVSAMLSGVVIKMGVYGLARMTGFLPQPPVAWGAILLILGAASGVLGVAFAIGQHDLKRLLAYHSVENIGIIMMGLGLAMVGRSMDRADWVALGMAGCLLHVWNHATFKSLLFFAAGSVLRVTHTREIDKLGGLAKTMPWTSTLFLIGAVAICGLPPLNGFVSEFFIYLGLLRTPSIGDGPSWTGAVLAVPVLATTGALAIACFVKVYGAVFLGTARTDATSGARESAASMVAPMTLLAGCCVAIGLMPFALMPALGHAVSAWAPDTAGSGAELATLAPVVWVGAMGLVLWALIGAGAVLILKRFPLAGITRACTWDCGYAQPTARMQYTASSFAQMLVGALRWPLRPRVHEAAIAGVFPTPSRFESHVDDVVLDGQILPAARAFQQWLGRLRGLQPRLTQHYVLCILVTVVAMLMWTIPFGQLLARIFSR